jgi:hypothetical protein
VKDDSYSDLCGRSSMKCAVRHVLTSFLGFLLYVTYSLIGLYLCCRTLLIITWQYYVLETSPQMEAKPTPKIQCCIYDINLKALDNLPIAV